MNIYRVSLDGGIEDGFFKAPDSTEAVSQACQLRGWTFTPEVYANTTWEMVDEDTYEAETLDCEHCGNLFSVTQYYKHLNCPGK